MGDQPAPTVESDEQTSAEASVDGPAEGHTATVGEGEAPDSVTQPPSREPSAGSPTSLEAADTPSFMAQPTLPSASEWHSLMSMATVISRSGLAPKVNGRDMAPEAVAVTALKGRELGIPPMMALSHVHVIEGKPTASAELMRALIQRSGHLFVVASCSPNEATVEFRRKEWPASMPNQRCSYTFEEAKAAGITGKGNWRKHPTDMLVARATSRAARQSFADCLMGASYIPEELGAQVDYTAEGEVVEVTVERDDAGSRQQRRPAPPADDGPVSGPQKQKLAILMKEKGIRSDGKGGDILYRASMQAAYQVDSIAKLSKRQASALIDVLENGKVDKATGEVQVSAEDMARRLLTAGANWLDAQDAAAEDDVTDAEIVSEEDADMPAGEVNP